MVIASDLIWRDTALEIEAGLLREYVGLARRSGVERDRNIQRLDRSADQFRRGNLIDHQGCNGVVLRVSRERREILMQLNYVGFTAIALRTDLDGSLLAAAVVLDEYFHLGAARAIQRNPLRSQRGGYHEEDGGEV